MCTWVNECRRVRDPPRGVSQGNDRTRQDLYLRSTLAAVFRIQRRRRLWSLPSRNRVVSKFSSKGETQRGDSFLWKNGSAVDGDLYRILMATSSRLLALPGVLRRSLSKII